MTETPRQILERHLDGSYQQGVLIELLSVTLLAELDALNARLDGIEKRLPVIQESRSCAHCIHRESPTENDPCRRCLLRIDRPDFVKISTQNPPRICPYCVHKRESRDKPACSNGCWGVSSRPNFVLAADANWK